MAELYEPLFRRFLYPAYESVVRGRKTLSYVDEYRANEFLAPDRLAELQWRKLKGLVEHSWEHVPFYRESWKRAGVQAPGDIRNLHDYARLPVLTKQDIRENFERLKAVPFRDALLYKTTGGSTGEPLEIGYTRESYQRRTAVMMRGYGWAGAHAGRRALYLWGMGRSSRGLKDRLHHAAFNRRMLDVFAMSDANMAQYAREIDEHRPRVIVSYVASAVRLAQWLLAHGRKVRAPESFICAAEPLHQFQRELIEEAFGCPVYNTYGCREFMLIASECEHRQGLHVNADHLHVELCGHGGDDQALEARQVLVTDLHNYGMPLMRYANGDIATPGRGQCPCGRGLPMLAKVDGRRMDALRTPQGDFIGEYLEYLVFGTPGIKRFQAYQERLDEIEVSVVRGPGFEESSLQQLESDMCEKFGHDVQLRFKYVEEVPLTPTGKLRVTISTLATSATAYFYSLCQWLAPAVGEQPVLFA